MSDKGEPDARLTREAIVAQVRNADDRLVLDLLAVGGTARDLAVALAWLTDDDAAVREGAAPPTGSVGEMVEILREAEAPSALDEP